MSLRASLTEIRHEGINELQEATPRQKLMLGATACALAFEWGTGNEALIGVVGGNVLRATNDTLLTAAAAGGASFGEQALFGMTAAASIHYFPRVTSAIRRKIVGEEDITSAAEVTDGAVVDQARLSRARKIGNRFLTAFALGTSINAFKNNATKEHNLQENTKNVIVDASLIGGGVAGIAAAAAGATNAGRSMGLQHEANTFVDIISSPFTYMGLFAAKSMADLRSWRRNRRDASIVPSTGDNREHRAEEHQVLMTLADESQVEYQASPSAKDSEALWEIVQKGFIDLNRKAYEKQDMTREEFDADMTNPDVLKYVAYDADHNPIGCLTVHQGLEEVTWADKGTLEEVQTKYNKPNPPYYVGTIVVPPDQQGSGVAKHLLQAALTHFNNDLPDALCFFDCADANYPWLAEFVENSAQPSEADNFKGIKLAVSEIYKKYWIRSEATGEITETYDLPSETSQTKVLDTQHYYSIVFQK